MTLHALENRNPRPACRHPRSGSTSSLYDSYDDFIVKTIDDKAKFDQNHRSPDGSIDRFAYWRFLDRKLYYERHLFLVTVHFRPGLFAATGPDNLYRGKLVFDAFKAWYLRVCECLLGSHYRKKLTKQPFTLAFLDVEGSRQGDPARTFQMPHIHAVMLLHPKTVGAFKGLLEAGRLAIGDRRISKIDILPFQDHGGGVRPMATYASKYARHSLRDGRHDMTFQQYPDVNAGRYPYLVPFIPSACTNPEQPT